MLAEASNSDALILGVLTLIGVITTGAVTPILIKRLDKKNSSQHSDGTEQRNQQTELLKEIRAVQEKQAEDITLVKKDVHEVKSDILAVKVARLEDKKHFLDLLERDSA